MINQALIILCKYPRKGSVKTRLALEIGEDEAVKFYQKCLEELLLQADIVANLTKVFLCYSDLRDKQAFTEWIKGKYELIDPVSENIEQNLLVSFERCIEQGFQKVISTASDVPDLNVKIIQESYHALDTYDIVMGPDNDGGFYLFGIKKFYPELFTYQYQTPNIFQEELKRVQQMNLKTYITQELIDIDTLGDLKITKSVL